MSDDLIKRLRDPVAMRRWWDQYGYEAADEIERLRELIEDQKRAIESLLIGVDGGLTPAIRQMAALETSRDGWKHALVAYIDHVGNMEGVTYLADRHKKYFDAADWMLLVEASDIAEGEDWKK
jgi:hypothetical protein